MHPPLPRNGLISVTAEVLSCQRRMSSEFNLGLAGTCRKKWLGLGSEEEHKKIPESVNFMHWKLANIPRLYKMLTLRGALLTTLYLLMNLRDTSFKISPPNACPSTSSSQQVNMKRMPLAFAAIILGALATDAQTVVTVLIPTGSCVPERRFSSEISSSLTYINTTILPLGTSTSLSSDQHSTSSIPLLSSDVSPSMSSDQHSSFTKPISPSYLGTSAIAADSISSPSKNCCKFNLFKN